MDQQKLKEFVGKLLAVDVAGLNEQQLAEHMTMVAAAKSMMQEAGGYTPPLLPRAKPLNSDGAKAKKAKARQMFIAKRDAFLKKQQEKEQGVAEAGPFSYGAKKPRKGSVADLAAKKRKEQERGRQPIEPRDQMVGVAKVIKGVAETIRNTGNDLDDMVEDYLDYLESIEMLDKSREEEKAQILADLEAGYLHSSEIEYALSGTKWDPLGEGMLDNPGQEDSPVAGAIIRRILLQRTDLLAKYGPEKVGQAVDEVADFVGDVDEIGSSDVSGWVKHVERILGDSLQAEAFQRLGKVFNSEGYKG